MSPTPVQLGLLSHFAAMGLFFLALLTPPSRLSHTQLALTFLPAIWACHIYSWSVGLGFLASVQALQATELLLFQDPRAKFQVIYRHKFLIPPDLKSRSTVEPDNTQRCEKYYSRKQPYPVNLWSRLQWVFKLHVSFRYVGWDTNSASRTSPPAISFPEETQSRSRWLVQNILLSALCFLLIDTTTAYQHLDPYFQVKTAIDESITLPLASILLRYGFGFLLPPRLVRILVLLVQHYAGFMLINRAFAITHVTFGGVGILDEWWGGVESWPMLMGSPVEALNNGLRGFWGKFWHQLFRSMFMSPGKVVVQLLRIKPMSFLAYAIKILVAFSISGIVHAASLPFNVPGVSPLRYALFFWIQGACLLFEVSVEQMLQGTLKGRSLWMRWGASFARLVWTVTVLYTTVPMFADEMTAMMRAVGLRETVLLPMSR